MRSATSDAALLDALLRENEVLRARLREYADPLRSANPNPCEPMVLNAPDLHFVCGGVVRVAPRPERIPHLEVIMEAAHGDGRLTSAHMVDKGLVMKHGWPYLQDLHQRAMQQILGFVRKEARK